MSGDVVTVPDPGQTLRGGDPIGSTLLSRPVLIRVCRSCGCTYNDCSVCIALTGRPCGWVTEYLCSACVEQAEELLRAYARNGNRSTSCGVIYRQAAANWRGNGPATVVIERAASVLREARPNASW